jgi:hypothetical protein
MAKQTGTRQEWPKRFAPADFHCLSVLERDFQVQPPLAQTVSETVLLLVADFVATMGDLDLAPTPANEVGNKAIHQYHAKGELPEMTVKGRAYIAGIFEHPTRLAPDKTVAQLHAEVALGALGDAGLTREDVDGYFCSGDGPGPGPASMAEYMNLKLRHMDSTDIGGASYIALAAHAAALSRRCSTCVHPI